MSLVLTMLPATMPAELNREDDRELAGDRPITSWTTNDDAEMYENNAPKPNANVSA